jgi:carbonic anhydrase
MAVIPDLVANNERFAEWFDQGELPMPPAKHVAVLACMDARMHPETFLGLSMGDAHMIRNAGGRASDDAIRSLIISTHLLGTVSSPSSTTPTAACSRSPTTTWSRSWGDEAGGIDFLPFSDLAESVRADVDKSRATR